MISLLKSKPGQQVFFQSTVCFAENLYMQEQRSFQLKNLQFFAWLR